MRAYHLLGFFLLLVLAGLLGCSLARKGIVSGSVAYLSGAWDLRLGGRRVILDTLQVYPGKVFYQLAIMPV